MTKTVKSMDVQTREVTFRELSFGVEYWVKGEPVGVPNPVKFAKADGKIFESSAGADKEGKGGFLKGFWAFSKSGGILIPFMYLFGLFGFLVCWPVTWWKARLANIFPPNKPGFIYTFLPFDRTGKSDFLTDKGNAYIREITKYWGKAMEAQNIKPSLWKDEEDFIKSDQQSQEEMRKKLWLKVGLPNIEKAIDICKNGVPGIKLEKKPLEYPFARVMLAVLENHRSNKNAWWASQEMDRAMGNTAVKELGNISGWTVMALWALGSIEPMLGLFGTVIGIRESFIMITDTIKENPNTELTVIVPQLAGGIHVALITTIVGLALGTPFTVLHYYYKGKIDWIAGKWEEIIIDVLNRA
jgi:biopolymer transport protein ExbB/TolQ